MPAILHMVTKHCCRYDHPPARVNTPFLNTACTGNVTKDCLNDTEDTEFQNECETILNNAP